MLVFVVVCLLLAVILAFLAAVPVAARVNLLACAVGFIALALLAPELQRLG